MVNDCQNAVVSLDSLSPARRWIVELCRSIQFGRIEGLRVRDGEPVHTRPPHVTREIKFGAEAVPEARGRTHDFLLKRQVIELLQQFDSMQEATIAAIEVRHGLPFRLILEEAMA